jgi:phosphatidylethanolamine/phosphatidyl-N-methylethanolamine N-methyltransferase
MTSMSTGGASAGRLLFPSEFIRNPARTGSFAPSSQHLAAAMIEPIPLQGDPVVVELGPGTGSFTRHIETRLAGRGRQVAVEVNPTLAARLAARHPRVDVLTADAARLPEILAALGVPQVDVVVCGLPWAAFDPVTQAAILDAVKTVLTPEGAFTTFGYGIWRWTPAALRMRNLLLAEFEEVVIGRTVTRNLPPAFVYYARRPAPREHAAAVRPAGPSVARSVGTPMGAPDGRRHSTRAWASCS